MASLKYIRPQLDSRVDTSTTGTALGPCFSQSPYNFDSSGRGLDPLAPSGIRITLTLAHVFALLGKTGSLNAQASSTNEKANTSFYRSPTGRQQKPRWLHEDRNPSLKTYYMYRV